MIMELILACSIAAQFAAAFMAFRLIRLTGKRLAWSLISAALALMAIRRIIPLYHLITGDQPVTTDIYNESIGLVLSCLMLVGIMMITPLFSAIKRSEDKLRSALTDKESLLQEVHHRVKNNLMIISSLLNLQMKRIADVAAREALRESDSRIASMSMIHEQVLRSGEYSSIDCLSYINNLSTNIRNSVAPDNKDIRLTIDIQPGITIGLNQAVCLGLIVNELVSNSFKYAFTGCEKCEITVSCRRCEDQVQLSIKDNGMGLPDEVDIDNPSSLGLQLVTILVKQLDGTIKYERDGGSKFTIMFSTKPKSIKEV
jgi:two-component sensor histidine kinase